MNFLECCEECLKNDDLLREFNRLWGHKLGVERKPIEKMVDKACGYDPNMKAMPDFVDFVYKFVWCPLLEQQEKEG